MVKVIYNSRSYIERGKFCEAILIDGGRIVRTGASGELLDAAPLGAEKIDAGGALVLPAFHDSHIHLMWIGRRFGGIEGGRAKSIDDVIRLGRELIARQRPLRGTYINGAGLNPDLFSSGEKRDLLRQDLDKISTEHPVIISRHCGHTVYCNSLAIKMAGLTGAVPEVEGGAVEKDAEGRPSGVFRENAAALLRKSQPEPSLTDMKRFLRAGMEKAQSLGITSAGSYDAGGPDFDRILKAYNEIYDESFAAGKPALRITMQCGISAREDMLDAYLERGIRSGAPLREHDQWGAVLRMGPVKLFVDGTLGGQTAWMKQPYRDKPETKGYPVMDTALLDHFIQKAAAGNMQTAVHAIGDAAVETALGIYEKITSIGHNPLRHGIIHCQVTSRDLIERMARNKILALVQPIFLADDMYILESRIGQELASTSYAWGTMNALGVPVSYGTDAPVSSLDPLLGIAWAARRQDPFNQSYPAGGFYPGERVDVYTAVDAYTAGSAFSAFEENTLGRIAPGFLADLVFIDKDIFSIPVEEIHEAKVLRTICAGETVYEASSC